MVLLAGTLGNFNNSLALANEPKPNKELVQVSTESLTNSVLPPKANQILLRPLVLASVAKCESGDKHFTKNGEVIRGRVNNLDIGRYQINLKYHGKKAEELGFDLFEEQGNELYAIWLYHNEGLHPWRHSKFCWSKYANK